MHFNYAHFYSVDWWMFRKFKIWFGQAALVLGGPSGAAGAE